MRCDGTFHRAYDHLTTVQNNYLLALSCCLSGKSKVSAIRMILYQFCWEVMSVMVVNVMQRRRFLVIAAAVLLLLEGEAGCWNIILSSSFFTFAIKIYI